jgi:hypothetical protein
MATALNTTLASSPQRRSFLAALLATPIVAAVPAAAATRTISIPETPGLLELGTRLTEATAELSAAIARKTGALALYERTRPTLPDELKGSHGDRHRGLTEDWEVPGGEVVSVLVWRRVKSEIILCDISRHTKDGKRLRRIARIAKKYADEECAALSASGLDAAKRASEVAAHKFIGLTRQLVKFDAHTGDGARIFASALPAFVCALPEAGYETVVAQERHMAIKLAEAFLRLDGAANEGGR